MTADLHARIAEALRRHEPPTHVDSGGLPADEFDCCVDAVMAAIEPEVAAIVSVGDKWAAPETSPYARLWAYAEGKTEDVSPKDVRELLTAFNATNAMLGVRNVGDGRYRRRLAAVKALADTGQAITPEQLREALATATRRDTGAHEH